MTRVDYSDLVGVKYRFLGRTQSGASCMWFPLEIHRRLGHEAIDPNDPAQDPEEALKQWDVIERGPWRLYDRLVIDSKGTGLSGHEGILVETDPPLVLHAVRPEGSVLTPLAHLEHKILFGYRWKKPA
ncbi:MAG: hypothetical protein V1929_03445 [bacterium]